MVGKGYGNRFPDDGLAQAMQQIHEWVRPESDDFELERLIHSIRKSACDLPIDFYPLTRSAVRTSIEQVLESYEHTLDPRHVLVYWEVMEYADLCRYSKLKTFVPRLRCIRKAGTFKAIAQSLNMQSTEFRFGSVLTPDPRNEGRVWKRVWPVIGRPCGTAGWGKIWCTLANGSPCNKECELRELSLCGASSTECNAVSDSEIKGMHLRLCGEGQKECQITVRQAKFIEHFGHFNREHGRRYRRTAGTGFEFEDVDCDNFRILANFIRNSEELDARNPPVNAPWSNPAHA